MYLFIFFSVVSGYVNHVLKPFLICKSVPLSPLAWHWVVAFCSAGIMLHCEMQEIKPK